MKNKTLKAALSVAIIAIVAVIGFIACDLDGGKTLESISVSTTKTAYKVGEELDRGTITVTANYNDGSKETVTDYAISGYDKNSATEQTVTVTYKGKTDTFTIKVVDAESCEECGEDPCICALICDDCREYPCICGDPDCNHEESKLGSPATIPATCTNKGSTTRECECGYKDITPIEVDPNAHDFSQWQITRTATCTVKAEETEKCSHCPELGTAKREVGEFASHTWTKSGVTPADCTNDATETWTCSVCTAPDPARNPLVLEDTAIGHDEGEWVGNELKCKRCGEVLDTIEPVYSISLSPASPYILPTRAQGYITAPTATITVTNTGNQPTGVLTVSAFINTDNFILSSTSLDSITPTDTTTFTVTPPIGLTEKASAYTVVIQVAGGNSISQTIAVNFLVTEPAKPTIYYGVDSWYNGDINQIIENWEYFFYQESGPMFMMTDIGKPTTTVPLQGQGAAVIAVTEDLINIVDIESVSVLSLFNRLEQVIDGQVVIFYIWPGRNFATPIDFIIVW